MAKKIVRGITDIKTISNQDLDTNNVNDLLSDGEHSYIHRKKKDGSEEYHNLTNNIKTIEAEDNGLLTVRNYNNSTNSAKLTVHHDPQKEQKLYSTDGTIDIVHGDNGSGEFTNVDVNLAKIIEMVAPTYHNYTDDLNGVMQTYKQPVDADNVIFHVTVRLNKNKIGAMFDLVQEDAEAFDYIIRVHGVSNEIHVDNGIFLFHNDLQSVEYYNNTTSAQYHNVIANFSFIIPKNPVNQ